MLKILLQRMQIDYELSAFFSEICLFYQILMIPSKTRKANTYPHFVVEFIFVSLIRLVTHLRLPEVYSKITTSSFICIWPSCWLSDWER